MDDIIALVEKLSESSPKQRRDALKELAGNTGISKLFLALKGDNRRPIARALCDLAGLPAAREIIARNMLINKQDILDLMKSTDAKLRKTTAVLIGSTEPEGFASELCDMLLGENTAFVRPSILLAMGNATAHERVKTTLQSYEIPKSDSVHMKAEQAALTKALSNMTVIVQTDMAPLKKGSSLILECANARIAVAELKSRGFDASVLKHPDNSVLVRNITDFEDIYRSRTFYTAHINVGRFETIEQATDAICTGKFTKLCSDIFGDNLFFRVEMREQGTYALSHAKRKAASEQIAAKVKKPMVNSPSKYLFQLTLVCTIFGIFLMITPPPRLDTRFRYRGISASVHPAAAASILFASKQYFSDESDVIDPFCGAGTLILERAKFPHKSLTGMDISMEALKTAKRNERDVRTGTDFVLKSSTSEFEQTYDEVLCNMPFGNRVSNHKKNEFLYKDFMVNLENILNPDGTALIFTQEKKLLMENLGNFELKGRVAFSCGGLFPALFILQRTEQGKVEYLERLEQKRLEAQAAQDELARESMEITEDDFIADEEIATDETELEPVELSSEENTVEVLSEELTGDESEIV